MLAFKNKLIFTILPKTNVCYFRKVSDDEIRSQIQTQYVTEQEQKHKTQKIKYKTSSYPREACIWLFKCISHYQLYIYIYKL